MNNPIPSMYPFKRSAMPALACLLLLSACSGSSNSSTEDESVQSIAPSVSETANTQVTDSTASENPNSNTGETSTQPSDSVQDDTVQVDMSDVRVQFDITVPKYQSNELLVRLTVGDTVVNAGWVSDELWSAVSDLPRSTQTDLTVSFYDRNGDITLGSIESSLLTSAESTQSIAITADQFDTAKWDDDADGFSNLAEVSVGSDPLVESSSLQKPEQVSATLGFIGDKTFRIAWESSDSAQYYRVLEAPEQGAGYTAITDDLSIASLSYDHRVALYNRVNARYIVQACNELGCTDSDELIVSGTLEEAIGHFAPNDENAYFGYSVSLSANGETLAIRASKGVHVFNRESGSWQQQALLGGGAVTLSGDGNTLVISRPYEGCGFASHEVDINGDSVDCSLEAPGSGSVYIFVRTGDSWQREARLKASVSAYRYNFGASVGISDDGDTLIASTPNATIEKGAAFVFTRSDGSWQEQAHLTAGNGEGEVCNSERPSCYRWGDLYGGAVDISGDGSTIAIGAPGEDSAATGINGNQADNSSRGAGAVYVYVRSDDSWHEQAYLKSNFDYNHPLQFGRAVALSSNGNTLVVGAPGDDSFATGVNAPQAYSTEGNSSGAVNVFERTGTNWSQTSFIKSSNTEQGDAFGASVDLSADGNTLAAKSTFEDSAASGINGDQSDNSAETAGAVYVFRNSFGVWRQHAYIKAVDTKERSYFGTGLSLSGDGETLGVSDSESTYLY